MPCPPIKVAVSNFHCRVNTNSVVLLTGCESWPFVNSGFFVNARFLKNQRMWMCEWSINRSQYVCDYPVATPLSALTNTGNVSSWGWRYLLGGCTMVSFLCLWGWSSHNNTLHITSIASLSRAEWGNNHVGSAQIHGKHHIPPLQAANARIHPMVLSTQFMRRTPIFVLPTWRNHPFSLPKPSPQHPISLGPHLFSPRTLSPCLTATASFVHP